MAEIFKHEGGFAPPTSNIRPPKIGHHYYWCRKCGHRFEGLLPVCPKCLSIKVDHDIVCHAGPTI